MNRSFQSFPIKRKLMAVMMLTSSAALLLSCVGFVGFQLLGYIQNEKQNLATLGDVIAANSTAALSFGDKSSAEDTLRGLKAEPSILNACLYGRDGTLFATYSRDGSDQSCPPGIPRGGSETSEYNRLTLSRSVVLNGQNIGTLWLQADLAPEVVAYLKRAVTILLCVMGASSLAALFLSRKLQHFISDPILGLAKVARVVTEKKDYSIRAKQQSGDETGLLIGAFNEMLDQIQRRDDALRSANDLLEKRVQERTEELRASEATLLGVFRATPIGINIMKGRVFHTTNDYLTETFGYPKESIIGQSARMLYESDEEFNRVGRELYGGLQAKGVGAVETMLRRADGVMRNALLTSAFLYREDPSAGVVVAFSDITEIKRAETALRDSEVRYRTVIDNASEAIWLMTDTFLECNKSACELWACNREDIIGHSPVEFSPPTQPDGKSSAQAAKERIDAAFGGEPQLFYWQHTRKDGTLIDTEISLTGVTIGGQRLVLAIGRDVTERKRAQAEMENLHRQLLDVSRCAGMAEVATNVLHNVGNVLNSVNVSATLVSEKIRESPVSSLAKVVALMRTHENDLAAFLTQDPKGRHLCDYLDNLAQYLGKEQTGIVHELKSLNADINHIKEIVAMQQNYARASGIVDTLPIVDLVEDALRMNNGALVRHQVHVVREYIATPSVPVDKHKVLQILVNLVRNAKYALDDGGGNDKRLTVRVGMDGDGFVKISIIDNGVGIPPENLTRVFEYGFTTRKAGHGFGLHSGALAAKEMGGSLSAHSDGPGQGATFTLSLPLHQECEKP
jgi:PAS domain S-box-containing protein